MVIQTNCQYNRCYSIIKSDWQLYLPEYDRTRASQENSKSLKFKPRDRFQKQFLPKPENNLLYAKSLP